MIQKQYRQGDVLLTPTKIPDKADKAKVGKAVVLAEGEATGHAHTIPTTATKVFVDGPITYLKVMEPTVLSHQEHAPITVEPGEYQVVRQMEFWLDEVRQVSD